MGLKNEVIQRKEVQQQGLSSIEGPPLTVAEFAKRMNLTRGSAYKLLTHEPGVLRINTPGSSKAIIRVPLAVVDRILRRAAIPA